MNWIDGSPGTHTGKVSGHLSRSWWSFRFVARITIRPQHTSSADEHLSTDKTVRELLPLLARRGYIAAFCLGRTNMFRYAVTIFISAFLLFQVQPLIGRFILPWFGGGPSIWTSCMLFFQILLLGGYLYAHLISVKLKPRTQVLTHLSLLAMSLVFLPIAPSDAWKPVADQSPLLQILLLLLVTVGGPYFMLSSTGPLMQKWFSQSSPGQSPWRLYALSNIGSLLALLSYPFVFEPWLALRQQVWSWSVVYGAYVLLATWCGIRYLQQQRIAATNSLSPAESLDSASPLGDASAMRPSMGTMLLWLGLAACSSAMLLATTNQLCIDVATVPFLWVLPLSLYLISFIICFDSPQWYDRRAYGLLLLACTPVACWLISEGADVNISKQVAIYATILFACCMTCHGELVSCKPHARYLTLFYVLISAGGALGGVFVAIVAPYMFHGYWEYHIGLVACCVVTLLAWCAQRIWLRTPSPGFWIWALITAANVALVAYYVYLPLDDVLNATDETIAFGVYGLLQFVGLIMTGVLEQRWKALIALWSILSAVLCAWFIGYGTWQFAGMISTTIRTVIIASAIVSPLVASACLWCSQKITQWWSHAPCLRYYLLGTLYSLVASVFAGLLHFDKIEDWQAVSFATTTGAALLMEWSARGFRGKDKASLGFWFWLPAITLILFLSNRLAVIVKLESLVDDHKQTVHMSRNFYGVLRVQQEASEKDDDFISPKYSLTHGQIKHGFQFIDEYWKTQPTTYYGRESGVGIAIQMSRERQTENGKRPLRVGVIGLGTGTLAAYGELGDTFRFYDINPDVAKLSDKFFTYLHDSPAKTEVVIGDARIMMEREIAAGQSQQFDVLAIDAFSSDAIPVHLLTSECGDIYRQHLKPGGILAVHISNRFLDLNPVSRGLAEHLGWNAYQIENSQNSLTGVFSSTWILLTADEELGADAAFQKSVTPWKDDAQILHWTDDYSGLWQVLSL
ncbi:MAG: hypothetical protein WCO86_01960 [Planctomycetota bacterium]